MFRSQLVKGTTALLILGVLREEELYGYEIAQRIRERSASELTPSEGTLYPALHRLEQDGALEAVWRDSDRGPRRRYYRITSSGIAMLAAHERDWASFAGGIGRILRGGTVDA
jgi:PadR family transcriptional regulator PadR